MIQYKWTEKALIFQLLTKAQTGSPNSCYDIMQQDNSSVVLHAVSETN